MRLGAAEAVLRDLRNEMFGHNAQGHASTSSTSTTSSSSTSTAAGVKDTRLFDLVFLDADKRMYGRYLDLLLAPPCMLRPGALIVVDNTLWKGCVMQFDEDQVGKSYMFSYVINKVLVTCLQMHIYTCNLT